MYVTHWGNPNKSIWPIDGKLKDLLDLLKGTKQIYLTHWWQANRSIWPTEGTQANLWPIDDKLAYLFDPLRGP